MPVHPTKGGYQWGGHGKVYRGPGAKAKAERQGAAAHASGYHPADKHLSKALKRKR
jgi:hypothetical protein